MIRDEDYELIHLDNLVDECGYFYSDSSCDWKCSHKDCSDSESRCFSWSCPVGHTAESDEIIKFGEEYDNSDEDWLIIDKRLLKNET